MKKLINEKGPVKAQGLIQAPQTQIHFNILFPKLQGGSEF